MKMTVRELRSLIREAINEAWGDEKLDVGDWVRLSDGTVSEILSFKKDSYKGQEIWLVTIRRPDGTRTQRADIMLNGARRALPNEVEDTKAAWEEESRWMAKKIDTSREGT